MHKIRILIVDDQTILRACLRMFIDAQSDMEVVGEAKDGQAALRQACAAKPDVVIMDIVMPDASGMKTIEQLLQVCPFTRVLVLTMYDEPAYARSALAAGGSAYISMRAPASDLLTAIRAVYRGQYIVDPTLAGPLLQKLLRKRLTGPASPASTSCSLLSPREQEVLIRLAQGYTNRQVAEEISLSVKTVETYRARIAEKLELHNRAELMRYARESGLLSADTLVSRSYE
jgi:two-component system, NarL family, response regulator NreC